MALILHLSDLHLGPIQDSDFPDDYKSEIVPCADRTNRQSMLKESLRQLSQQFGATLPKLDALVISGDITYKNDEEGFRLLDGVLQALGPACPPASMTVVVPGNHDVKWQSKDARERYGTFIKYMRDEKHFVTPLLEGIDIINGDVEAANLDGHYLSPSDQTWAILPINSSHYCGSVEAVTELGEALWSRIPGAVHRSDPTIDEKKVANALRHLRLQDVARVSDQQLRAIRRLGSHILSTKTSAIPPITIAVLHHQILPVSTVEEFKPYESITNLGQLRTAFRDNNISMALHGHKHIDFVYYDYIPNLYSHSGGSRMHRVLVVSAPHLGTPGAKPIEICRLIEVSEAQYAPSVSLRPVLSTRPGTQTEMPGPQHWHLWQDSDAAALTAAPINLVEGNTLDEAYERALALFIGLPPSSRIANLVCRIARPEKNVTPPHSYPPVEDSNPGESNGWFEKTVRWWQKKKFARLSGDDHFNHGNRIFRYNSTDQVEAVVKAIKEEPLTSRGVITLLKPSIDVGVPDSRFPSFCFVQFLIRRFDHRYSLDAIAHFRKQEIRYWFPVNIAEIALLQSEIFEQVKDSVDGELQGSLELGSITSIAAIAHRGEKVPTILVPVLDFDLEENPSKLWDMTYGFCVPTEENREPNVAVWEGVLQSLIPPVTQDSSGVPVPIQGVLYLEEISTHFSRHFDRVGDLAREWRALGVINRNHAKLMASGSQSQEQHTHWRSEVLVHLNRIREFVNAALGALICQFE